MSSEILFYILVALFVILNILDAHSTLRVISKSSYRNEKNPIARFLFKIIGPVAGVIVLKIILVPVIFLMFFYFRFSRFDMNLVLIIANVFYLLVVIHNYKVAIKLVTARQILEEMDLDNQ